MIKHLVNLIFTVSFWRGYDKTFVTFGEAMICFIIDIGWTNQECEVENTFERATKFFNQVLCFTTICRAHDDAVK